MPFNYEQSIWGRGEADLAWSSPTSFRLRQALFALKNLQENSKILEVGCGAGQFVRAIKKTLPDAQCLGCDVSRRAVEEANKLNDGVEYTVSESARLPFADSSLDAVLVFDVLEHAQDVDGLLAEINRVLKKDGIFYCFVPCENDLLSFWKILRSVNIGKDLTKKYAGHINYFSRESIIVALKGNGFQIVKLRYSDHILGQLVGVISFFLMDRASKKQGGTQINNEQYFEERKNYLGQFGIYIKKIVNSLIFIESTIMSIRLSPNIHIISKKI
ncbi:MAG: methyltransferase domain-containing protein [bacterium]